MHALRPVALELPDMNRLIDRAMEVPITQAIVLDLNPFWMLAQRLEQAGLNPDAAPLFFRGGNVAWLAILSLASMAGVPFDLGRRYGVVGEIAERLFGRDPKDFQPFIARIVTRPPGRREDESEMRRYLGGLARETPFPTVVEARALPQPLVNPGDRCHAPAPGTIGGFVRDQATGRIYGVTCGHVAAASVQVTAHGSVIGRAVYSRDPFAAAAGGAKVALCRPGATGVARLDMALIDLAVPPGANVVTTRGALVQRGDPIDMHVRGKIQPYEVGGAVLTSSIKGACFDRLFEVVPRPSSWMTPLVNLAATTMPAPGDSGAWIVRSGTTDWCGMLIAGEPTMGYALESDDLLLEASGAFGLSLVIA